MVTLIDTSAIYAYLDSADDNHAVARETWAGLLTSGDGLLAHNYVVVECTALLQRRLGSAAVRTFFDDITPLFDLRYVDDRLHSLAQTAMLASLSRSISLVDWTSFVLMRELGVDRAFAFDDDFAKQGLTVMPPA